MQPTTESHAPPCRISMPTDPMANARSGDVGTLPELMTASCTTQGNWVLGLTTGHVIGYSGCTPMGPRAMLRDCWYATGPGLTPGSPMATVMVNSADVAWCAVAERYASPVGKQ